MKEDIKKNIKKAQAKQSHHYNIKHGAGSSYIIGLTVLKIFPRKRRRGGCLQYRWEGPYIILESLGKGLFKLQEVNGNKVSLIITQSYTKFKTLFVYFLDN